MDPGWCWKYIPGFLRRYIISYIDHDLPIGVSRFHLLADALLQSLSTAVATWDDKKHFMALHNFLQWFCRKKFKKDCTWNGQTQWERSPPRTGAPEWQMVWRMVLTLVPSHHVAETFEYYSVV